MRKLLIIIIFFCCNSLVSSEYIVNTGKLEIDGSIDFVKFSNKDDSIAFAGAGNKLYMLKLPEFEVMWEYEFHENVKFIDTFYDRDSIVIAVGSNVYLIPFTFEKLGDKELLPQLGLFEYGEYNANQDYYFNLMVDYKGKYIISSIYTTLNDEVTAAVFSIFYNLQEKDLKRPIGYGGGPYKGKSDSELFINENMVFNLWQYYYPEGTNNILTYNINTDELNIYDIGFNEYYMTDLEPINKDTVLLSYIYEGENYIMNYCLSTEEIISNKLLYKNCRPKTTKHFKDDLYFHIRNCGYPNYYEMDISRIDNAFSDEYDIIDIDEKYDFSLDKNRMITASSTNILTLYDFSTMITNVETEENNSKSNNISIHPNPTNDILHIESDTPVKLSITNTAGQIVKTIGLIQSDEIDISDLIPGVYFLVDENNELVGKFVKE